MQRLIKSGLITLVTTTALCGAGCKRTATDDSATSAARQVEQAQQESKEAYDRAKEAQDNALDEQKEATKAADEVNEKRQELAEAEAKAATSVEESQAAQAKAQQEGEAAQQQAQAAQQRAAQLQQQQAAEQAAGSYAGQARTADTHQMQKRTSQPGRFSWVEPGAWDRAPTGETPAGTTTQPSATQSSTVPVTNADNEVTRAVENTAIATVVKDAMTKSVSKNEIIVTSGDATSFHMIQAKLSPDTKITRNGEAASLADIKAGDRVTVAYTMEHNQPIATSIEILGGQ